MKKITFIYSLFFIFSFALSSHASLQEFDSIDDVQEWAMKNPRSALQHVQEKVEQAPNSVNLWYTGAKASDYINGKEAGHPNPLSVIRLILDLDVNEYEISCESVSKRGNSNLIALFDVYNPEDNILEVLTVLMPMHFSKM